MYWISPISWISSCHMANFPCFKIRPCLTATICLYYHHVHALSLWATPLWANPYLKTFQAPLQDMFMSLAKILHLDVAIGILPSLKAGCSTNQWCLLWFPSPARGKVKSAASTDMRVRDAHLGTDTSLSNAFSPALVWGTLNLSESHRANCLCLQNCDGHDLEDMSSVYTMPVVICNLSSHLLMLVENLLNYFISPRCRYSYVLHVASP